MIHIPSSYRGLFVSVGRYWKDYGGWKDFFGSPLLHLSVVISGASYRAWLKTDWVDLPLSLLPNLLGFSLGAYALIFSLANERLLGALSAQPKHGGPTLLRVINATFLHFILIQTAAIIFALSQKSTLLVDLVGILNIERSVKLEVQRYMTITAGAFGYWLTVYAVVLLVGAAIAAYRLAIMSGKAATPTQNQTGLTSDS